MAPIFAVAATQLLVNASVPAGLSQWNSSNQPGRGDLQQQHLHLGAAGERTSLISLARSAAGSLQRKRAAKRVGGAERGKAAEMPAQAAGAETAQRTEFDVEQRLEGLDGNSMAEKTRTALEAVSSKALRKFGISKAGFQNLTVTLKKMAAELFTVFDKNEDGQVRGTEVQHVQSSLFGRRSPDNALAKVFPPMFTIHQVMASLVTMVPPEIAQLMMMFKDYIAESAFFGVSYKQIAPQDQPSMLQLGAVYSPASHSRANVAEMTPCEGASVWATIVTVRSLLAIPGITVGDKDTFKAIVHNARLLKGAVNVSEHVHIAENVTEALPRLPGFIHEIYNSGVLITVLGSMFSQMSSWDWSVMIVQVASTIFTIFPIDSGVSINSIAMSVPELISEFRVVRKDCSREPQED